MRRSSVFFESFLDGFTMAGFLTRLRQPGAATQLLASSPDNSELLPLSVMVEETSVVGSLRQVPDSALQSMITLLKKEDEHRKLSREAPEKAGHGSSR